MPKLIRYQHCGCFHFATCSCYRRQPLLGRADSPLSWSYNGHNNRIDGPIYTYDPAGNRRDVDGNSYLYDDENRVVYVSLILGGSASYSYDAEGQRIRKVAGTTTEEYVYDAAGHQFGSMQPNGSMKRMELYAGNRHLATYDIASNSTYFNHGDWLGTERLRTNVAGTPSESCTSLPYGDGQTCTGSDTSPMHYTGKERDTESGNDYFGARYFASTMGRFMSPDWASNPQAVPYASYTNPQTLNLYNYMRNNPLSGTDEDGHCCDDGSPQERLLTGIVGGINLYVSVKKGVAAVAEAATSETGVGALAALYTGNQAVNQGAGGIRQIFGAITGNTKDANEYADNLAIHSSIVGTTTLAITKDKDLAVGATAAEGIASTTVVKKLPEMLDWGLNAFQVLTSAKPKPDTASQPAPAPATQPTPPAPKPPPPPPCNQAGGKC